MVFRGIAPPPVGVADRVALCSVPIGITQTAVGTNVMTEIRPCRLDAAMLCLAAGLASFVGCAYAQVVTPVHGVVEPETVTAPDRFTVAFPGERVRTEGRAIARLSALAEGVLADGVGAKRFVIQLDGPITPGRRLALENAGLRLGDYLPANAYVVTIDPRARMAELDAIDFVQWGEAMRPEWKMDTRIGTRPYVSPERIEIATRGEVALWAHLYEGEGGVDVQAAIGALEGVRVLSTSEEAGHTIVAVTAPPDAARKIAAINAVSYVEEAPEATLRNSTSRTIVQSGAVGPTPFYDRGITGVGQVVGLIDSRMDLNHCSFKDTVAPGPTHRKVLAFNASSGSAASHGTHTAGTLAGDNGDLTDTRGVAYGAKMVFNLTPSDVSTGTTFLSRLNQHHTQGARVHSNSWGADNRTDYNGWSWAIDRFSRDNEDSVVAFAVTNQSLLYTPENAKSCLAVGASQDNTSINNHCSGGQGPTADGRRKPETYAPGCSTSSSSSGTTCGLRSLTGTSMACPAVTGAAALFRQYFTDGFYPSGAAVLSDAFTPTGALVRAMVINASVDMTGISGYPSNREGWGRLVGDVSAHFAGDARGLIVHDIRNSSPESLSTGGSHEWTFNVDGSSEQLRVTMTFTDVPATLGATFVPVNNIDLEVIAPDGSTVYKGNNFNTSTGVSVAGGSADAINSTEQVHVTNPPAGQWTVRVLGTAVNQETQGFGLVITGDVSEAGVACYGDVNGDGVVNFADLNIVLSQFGQSGVGLQGDVDGDGAVGFSDLNVILSNFGQCIPA